MRRSQEECDPVPGRMCSRMAVKEKNRRTRATMADAQSRVGQLDHLKCERVEHRTLPAGSWRRNPPHVPSLSCGPQPWDHLIAPGVETQILTSLGRSANRKRTPVPRILQLLWARREREIVRADRRVTARSTKFDVHSASRFNRHLPI